MKALALSFVFKRQRKNQLIFSFCVISPPRRFDCFDYCPLEGASGGILVAWNSNFFYRVTIDKQFFAVNMAFTSTFNQAT